MQEGLQGRMTDGILVRVSQRVNTEANPGPTHQLLEAFAGDLVKALPEQTRGYLVR